MATLGKSSTAYEIITKLGVAADQESLDSWN